MFYSYRSHVAVSLFRRRRRHAQPSAGGELRKKTFGVICVESTVGEDTTTLMVAVKCLFPQCY